MPQCDDDAFIWTGVYSVRDKSFCKEMVIIPKKLSK